MASDSGSPVGKSVTLPDRITDAIHTLRGHRVLLDADLAAIYGVSTKRLNEQVRRNHARFPEDFAFRLTADEARALRSHFATSSRHGGRRYSPLAFTEHGAVMLASVLNSPVAIEASIQVVRAFVKLRLFLMTHAELSRKLDEMEQKYDAQFKAVFDAIRSLMLPTDPTDRKRIGFRSLAIPRS